MKKTLTINLNGIVYHIDEDAYALLKKYLNNIQYYFRNEDGVEEIMLDIEARIAELFSEQQTTPLNVINKKRVEEVIEQLGQPEEIAGDERIENESNEPHEQKKKKRLYRDSDDKIVGGVISGMAIYLGVDVTSLRLLTILAFFFSLSTFFVIYLICWLIIPEAKTAEEKLNMRGEDITLQNIGKTVTQSFDKAQKGFNDFVKSDQTRTGFQRFFDGLVGVLGVLLKVGLFFLAFCVGIPVLFTLFIVFLILIAVGISTFIGGGVALFSLFPFFEGAFFSTQSIPLFVSSISGLIVIGLPIFSLFYMVFQRVFQWKNMARGIKTTLIILWAIALFCFVFFLLQIDWSTINSLNDINQQIRFL